MILTRKLALVLLWALWFISFSVSKAQPLDPTQTYYTGNLVQPTPYGGPTPWINGVYQSELTCWAWGNPGYCGPNPIVRPGNDINFSFGWTDLYQQQSIGSLLPNSGTGLVVNGYNFGFQAKNGNGWDDGRVDNLFAYVQFNKPDGSTLLNHTHNLTYQFNWTQFNYNYTFNTPYRTGEIGSVRYGFVGNDSNYWAGPYGPEINNVSFSLKYSVDPCTVNVLSSPSCPGYLEALAKLNPPAPISAPIASQPVTETYSLVPTTTTTSSSPTLTAPVVSTAPSTPTTASSQSTTSTAVSTPSVSAILNIVRREQARISNVEGSAVTQAIETVTQSSNQAQQVAERVASVAAQSSGTGLVIQQQTSSVSFQTQGQSSVVNTEVSLVGPNPLRDQIETTPQNQQTQIQENSNQRQLEVKRNVQDNDAAAGVSIAMLAKQPPGFELYMIGIRDSNFYPPKEIYRNQTVVDNQRVLRQLNNRSDRMHEEMINEQYRRQ